MGEHVRRDSAQSEGKGEDEVAWKEQKGEGKTEGRREKERATEKKKEVETEQEKKVAEEYYGE
jgi:hypothetical protein